MKAVQNGRSPVVLTERNEHLDFLLSQLSPHIHHLIVLRGGMGTKEITQITSRLRNIPENEERVLLATGRFIHLVYARHVSILSVTSVVNCLYACAPAQFGSWSKTIFLELLLILLQEFLEACLLNIE